MFAQAPVSSPNCSQAKARALGLCWDLVRPSARGAGPVWAGEMARLWGTSSGQLPRWGRLVSNGETSLSSKAQPREGLAVPVLSPLTLSLALLQGCLLLSPALLLVCAEAGKTLSSVPGWTLSWSSNQLSLSVLCKSLNFALLEVELSGLL